MSTDRFVTHVHGLSKNDGHDIDDEINMSNPAASSTPSDAGSRRFYHGTRADPKPGDMIQGGYSSNYTERRSPSIYFCETVFAATWRAELAKGESPGRSYAVEPTGPFMDDPNVTRSFRAIQRGPIAPRTRSRPVQLIQIVSLR